jgi:predicted nucleic acid-binding protein
MTAYVDSSIVLRVLLGQAGMLAEWRDLRRAVASALVEVECLRTLDRIRLRTGIPGHELVSRREAVYRLLEAMEVVDVSRGILSRAAQPLPTELGTLDAIHLATALSWREDTGEELVMATHDVALGTAARSCGLRVIGTS